jgi:hypothetical protein
MQRNYDDSPIGVTELDVAASLAGEFKSDSCKDPDDLCS